jgi:hypothetical protein
MDEFDELFKVVNVSAEDITFERGGGITRRYRITLEGQGGHGIGLTGLIVYTYVNADSLNSTVQGRACQHLLEAYADDAATSTSGGAK